MKLLLVLQLVGSWEDIIHADYDCRCYYDGVAEEHQFGPLRAGLGRVITIKYSQIRIQLAGLSWTQRQPSQST